MQFGHEQPDVCRLAIDSVAWPYSPAKELSGIDRHARDQLLRASQSISLNIAGGKGKTELDRMAAMPSRLGGRGYGVKEEYAVSGSEGIDFDPDSDFDLDDNESQR